MQLQDHSQELIDGHAILAAAVAYAADAHYRQVRKGTTIPYVSHLLQVAGLVLEHGGSLEVAAAGALHDALEDTSATVDEVRKVFGDKIADILVECTDTTPEGSPEHKAPWIERKTAHLTKLHRVSKDAALVIACDKLHNLRTQIYDLAHAHKTVAFNAPYTDRRWLAYQTLEALRGLIPERLYFELADATHDWADLNELR